MIKLTAAAVNIMENAIKNEQKDEMEKLYIRLSMGIGWGGPQLKLSLEERPLGEDKEFTVEGIHLLIHQKDLVYFEHTKLDFVSDVFGTGRFQLLKVWKSGSH